MSRRREIQQAHERAQVALFLEWFNQRYKSSFKVIAEPNPPEAIISSGRVTRWVEVTDAFWSDAYAQDEYSYATPGETHKPISKGVHVEPDAQFAGRFVEVVKKKLEKSSYLPSKKAYGPGYLIVPIMYPLFSLSSLQYVERAWSGAIIQDLGCFRSIYITYRAWSDTFVQRWTAYGSA